MLSGATDINQLSPEAIAIASRIVNGAPLGSLTVPNPFLNLPADQCPAVSSILGRSTVTVAQLLRPYPQFGNVVSYSQNEAHSSYHSLQLTASRRVGDGLSFTAAYAFSKSIDDLTSMSLNNQTIQIQYYQDYHNRHADKSLSNFNVTDRFIGDVTWQLPFGHDRRFLREGWLSKIFGGFSANAMPRTSASSAAPKTHGRFNSRRGCIFEAGAG